MQDRVTFYSHGFLVQPPEDSELPIAVFIRFYDIVRVYLENGTVYIQVRNTKTHYLIIPTFDANLGIKDQGVVTAALAKTIIEHWIKWIEGQSNLSNQSLVAQVADLADAIRHLPTVEIAGEVVQEAGTVWKEKTTQ